MSAGVGLPGYQKFFAPWYRTMSSSVPAGTSTAAQPSPVSWSKPAQADVSGSSYTSDSYTVPSTATSCHIALAVFGSTAPMPSMLYRTR